MQMFTVKMSEGVLATSYNGGDRFFIDPYKLLPLDRFLPQPKGAAGTLLGPTVHRSSSRADPFSLVDLVIEQSCVSRMDNST
jgi:hypothetical protein